MKAPRRNMVIDPRPLGKLKPAPDNPRRKGKRWHCKERILIRGDYQKRDVEQIQQVKLRVRKQPTGVPGRYAWVDPQVESWGGANGSGPTGLVIIATLEYTENPPGRFGEEESLLSPMLGDLEVTLTWSDPGPQNDPYELLLVTKMMYPLP